MSWERESYSKKIDDLESNLTNQVMSANSGEELRDITSSFVSHFRKLIKDFFSSKDGEGDKIKKMYASVYDYNPCRRRLDIQDMNNCFNTYMTYIDGMNVFINKSMADTTSEGLCDTISGYMDKDKTFISSLFGDGTNAKSIENITVQEALVNIEVLIDFIPKLEACTECIDKLLTQFNTGVNCDVDKQLMKFYLLSNIRYSSRLIKYVFDSFYQIVDVMSGHVISVKTENAKQEPFKLLL